MRWKVNICLKERNAPCIKKLYYTIQYSVSRMESQDQTLYYKKKKDSPNVLSLPKTVSSGSLGSIRSGRSKLEKK